MFVTAESILAELEQHKAELRALGVRRLGLFGSAARGEAGPESDLDFIVEFGQVPYDSYVETEKFLQRLFDRKVQMGSLADLRPELKPFVLPDLRYAQID